MSEETFDFEAQITFLPCTDLEATARFYQHVVGLSLTLDQGSCRIFRALPGAYLGFCQRQRVEVAEGVILTLVTDQVDAFADRLESHGVTLESGPVLNPRFHIYHLFFRDPDGHLLEVQRFEDPAWPADP